MADRPARKALMQLLRSAYWGCPPSPKLCEHCGAEIEAFGEWNTAGQVAGLSPYRWRHVESGQVDCGQLVQAAEGYAADHNRPDLTALMGGDDG